MSRLWAKKNYKERKVPNHKILGAQLMGLCEKVTFSSCIKAKVSCLWLIINGCF